MNYKFKDCPHHHICLYHELEIQMGFDKTTEIRRKGNEFEVSMKKRISSTSPYREEIFTGSIADGFRHGNQDIDTMNIFKDIKVLDFGKDREVVQTREPSKTITLTISKYPQYWEEGYVLLKYTRDGIDSFEEHVQCINYSKLNGFVSSHRFKEALLELKNNADPYANYFIHGPCISFSGVSRDLDIAYSLECNFWPSQAKEWVKRPRLWPSQQLVDEIVQNGCHIVPLGPLKGVKDDLFWRLSFNTAEQKLVFAFNHTQFLCYGLLKAVMKGCIQKIKGYPENTLCSYFIKTLMFWMIQDTATELWQPHNILICYVLCLVRLTLWVNKVVCPNFFIPSRNMFKTKITGQTKTLLLNTMIEVFKMGVWNSFARCSNFFINHHFEESAMPYYRHYFINESFLRECRQLSCSFVVDDHCHNDKLEEFSNRTFSELEAEYFVCQKLSMYQKLAMKHLSHRDQIKYFTMAKSLDLTRGPLMLATCLYCTKKYTEANKIIEDTKRNLGDFTFFAGVNNAHTINFQNTLDVFVISPQNLRYSLREKREKLLAMDIIIHKATDVFTKTPNWRNIPDEIHFDFLFQGYCLIIHPLVYLYFLDFLCSKHLKKMDNALTALKKQENIVPNVCKYGDRPVAHLILGIMCEEVKRFGDAISQYEKSLSLRSTFTSALCRSYLLRKYIKYKTSCCPILEYDLD